jgi:hypothetical protein
LIGLDTIFGAFLFGLCIPRGTRLYHQCREYIETFVLTFTLPLYFALSGIKTDVSTISTGQEGAMVILVVVLACVSKITGCTAAGVYSGLNLREAAVVGTFMNTKGLVELIVLNVGLNAGILTTKTFSVMVLMALFTTFMTSPLIELLYPERMRKIAVTDEDKGTEMVELERNLGGGMDLNSLPNRVGIVIESLTQMQGFVNLLGYFIPQEKGSQLATTIMHFYEPTNSDKDSFIGLNEQNRLIRVDEEPTDIATALWLKEKDASIKKPELLPISCFCKAFQIPVNAFRIEGDPVEYPVELRSISANNDISLLLLPFRAQSQFSSSFFWESLKTAPAPVLLVAEMHPPADREHPVETQAEAARTIRPRARTGSFYTKADITSDLEAGLAQPEAPVLYSNVPADAMPIHRRRSVTNRYLKLANEPKRNNVVVALLLGKSADLIILSLLPRFAQNKSHDINVALPKDYASFPEVIRDAVKTMKDNKTENSNIHFTELHSISIDFDGMINELNSLSYDLLLSSFVEPKEDPALRLLSSPENSYVNTDAVMRLISTRNTNQERIRTRVVAGMPDNCVYSNVVHPELGLFGSRLYDKNQVHNGLVVVVHEPMKVRKPTREAIVAQAEEQPSGKAHSEDALMGDVNGPQLSV